MLLRYTSPEDSAKQLVHTSQWATANSVSACTVVGMSRVFRATSKYLQTWPRMSGAIGERGANNEKAPDQKPGPFRDTLSLGLGEVTVDEGQVVGLIDAVAASHSGARWIQPKRSHRHDGCRASVEDRISGVTETGPALV